jgi:signal transduction histidine kinase
MSSDDSIQNNMPATLEPEGTASWRETYPNFDPTRHMAPAVAHELNNILTVVQGYADRLLLHHGGDPALMPHLKQISEAARRAAVVVRKATPPKPKELLRTNSHPVQVA